MPNGEFALRSSLVPDQLRRVHSRQTQRQYASFQRGRGKFTPVHSATVEREPSATLRPDSCAKREPGSGSTLESLLASVPSEDIWVIDDGSNRRHRCDRSFLWRSGAVEFRRPRQSREPPPSHSSLRANAPLQRRFDDGGDTIVISKRSAKLLKTARCGRCLWTRQGPPAQLRYVAVGEEE